MSQLHVLALIQMEMFQSFDIDFIMGTLKL